MGFFGGCMWLILKLLEENHLNKNLLIIFAWNPLVIVESAASGHLDIMGAFFLLLALFFLKKGYFLAAMAGLGCSVMIKYLPFVFIPFFLLAIPKNRIYYFAIFILTCVVLYLPYMEAQERLFHSLQIYYNHWSFNSLPYTLFMEIFNSRIFYIGIVGVVLGTIILYQLLSKNEALHSIFILAGAVIFLSPVVYPWYLIWFIPFLVFKRCAPFILFSYLVNLSYVILPLYLQEGIWKENILVMWIEYGLFLIFFAVYYKNTLLAWLHRLKILKLQRNI